MALFGAGFGRSFKSGRAAVQERRLAARLRSKFDSPFRLKTFEFTVMRPKSEQDFAITPDHNANEAQKTQNRELNYEDAQKFCLAQGKGGHLFVASAKWQKEVLINHFSHDDSGYGGTTEEEIWLSAKRDSTKDEFRWQFVDTVLAEELPEMGGGIRAFMGGNKVPENPRNWVMEPDQGGHCLTLKKDSAGGVYDQWKFKDENCTKTLKQTTCVIPGARHDKQIYQETYVGLTFFVVLQPGSSFEHAGEICESLDAKLATPTLSTEMDYINALLTKNQNGYFNEDNVLGEAGNDGHIRFWVGGKRERLGDRARWITDEDVDMSLSATGRHRYDLGGGRDRGGHCLVYDIGPSSSYGSIESSFQFHNCDGRTRSTTTTIGGIPTTTTTTTTAGFICMAVASGEEVEEPENGFVG